MELSLAFDCLRGEEGGLLVGSGCNACVGRCVSILCIPDASRRTAPHTKSPMIRPDVALLNIRTAKKDTDLSFWPAAIFVMIFFGGAA